MPLAAERGKLVFNGAGKCATCHSGDEFTDANSRLHPATDVVSEPEPDGAPSYASRSATKQYRTAPLQGSGSTRRTSTTARAATLEDVVKTYNGRKSLGLTVPDRRSRAISQVAVGGPSASAGCRRCMVSMAMTECA